jgi:hypothetical protein
VYAGCSRVPWDHHKPVLREIKRDKYHLFKKYGMGNDTLDEINKSNIINFCIEVLNFWESNRGFQSFPILATVLTPQRSFYEY